MKPEVELIIAMAGLFIIAVFAYGLSNSFIRAVL